MTIRRTSFAIVLLILAPLCAPAQHIFEHTPGFDSYRQGMQAYERGNYWQAQGHLKRAARWADKMAQFYVGVIYFNGEGVEQDRPRGWAWIHLAAERDYPPMLKMSAQVWAGLDDEERARGLEILESELEPVYGDQVTLPRTARRMHQDRMQATGSRLGRVGNVDVIEGATFDRFTEGPGGYQTSADTHAGGSRRKGHEFYDDQKWDLDLLLEIEARAFRAAGRGRVEIRDFEDYMLELSGEDPE